MSEPLAGASAAPPQGSVLTTGGVLLAIGGLYFGREFFIPFTLAVLLAFALAPIVTRLRRLRLPRVASVLLTVCLALTIIGALSYVVTTQLIRLADALPGYQQTMQEKIRSFRTSASAGGGVLGRVTSTVEGLSREISGEGEADAKPATSKSRVEALGDARPVPVVIEPGTQSPIDVVRTVVGPLVAPLATGGIMVVFLIFILLEREDLRDRFIKLVGAGDLKTTTEALNEAASRVSRYLVMQLIVNVSYGLPIGIGLYIIGVPNAVLWGVLSTVLRFIPFLGPFLAALFPVTLAFAVDPGWSMMLWVIGLFVVAELISNNVVEPWLYGASTGLSSLAIIAAAIFWTTLWGPIGLILSTPLTVCLIVMGRYVPQLNFLGVLLGSDPVLAPQEQLYQRLLAGNAEEAADIAETYVEEHSLREFYDQIAVPALRLAENDRQHRSTYGTYKETVAQGMISVVRDVAEHAQRLRLAESAKSDAAPVRRALVIPKLCIGGRTDLDCAAAEMVAQVMVEHGIESRVLSPLSISQGGIGQLDVADIEVVCLTCLAAQPQAYARFVCNRLKRRAPEIKTIVCVLNPTTALPPTAELERQMSADAVVYSLEAAADQIEGWISPPLSDPMQPAPIPENEESRLAALRGLGLTSGQDENLDRLAAKVAAAFGTAIALVTVVDEAHQRWPGAFGLPPRLDARRMDARETSICGHVVAANDVLVTEDVAKDPRFANNAFLVDNGIRFYAGAPLRTAGGLAIGSLCVIDTKPRSFSDADRATLQKLATDLMSRIEADARRKAPVTPTSPDHHVH
ncbi:MAG TPA: AI-2E family transporter [Candidatus Binatia bacterium]|nr:AI-2E family transporter [Candidatus Binatia bacterium]